MRTLRAIAAWLAALMIVAGALPDAAARPEDHALGRAKKHRKRARRSDKLPNLPRGWAWPPTEAMRVDGERCLAHLAELGVAFDAGPETLRVTTPIVVPSMAIGGVRLVSTKAPRASEPPVFVMDCRFAEAMAATGAPILRAAGVAELRFSSLYVDRNVVRGGRRRGILSRHALGLALDVFSFVDDTGRAHVVLTDYRRDPMLRGIEREFDASPAWRHVLTPGKDRRSHRDHFHFEARTIGDKVPVAAPPTS